MEEQTFTLRPEDEYIELNKLLQVLQIAQTGGHAKIMIEEGEVVVDGEVEFRKRNKLRDGAIVIVGDTTVRISK